MYSLECKNKDRSANAVSTQAKLVWREFMDQKISEQKMGSCNIASGHLCKGYLVK